MTQPFQVTEAEEEADELPAAPAGTRVPFEPTGLGRRAATRGRRLRIGVVIAAVIVAAVAGIMIVSSGDDGGTPAGAPKAEGDSGSGQPVGDRKGNGKGGGSATEEQSTTADATTPPAEPASPPQTTADAGGGSTDGYALNDEGFALVGQGRYDEAIPVLQKAVDALRSSGDEQTYNYALYNLGSAYVGAGRYDEAIPVLQERMQYDDGQLDTVQEKLDEALAGAGEAPTGGTKTKPPKEPKEPKPGNPAPPGQTGAVPPGHQDEVGEGD